MTNIVNYLLGNKIPELPNLGPDLSPEHFDFANDIHLKVNSIRVSNGSVKSIVRNLIKGCKVPLIHIDDFTIGVGRLFIHYFCSDLILEKESDLVKYFKAEIQKALQSSCLYWIDDTGLIQSVTFQSNNNEYNQFFCDLYVTNADYIKTIELFNEPHWSNDKS